MNLLKVHELFLRDPKKVKATAVTQGNHLNQQSNKSVAMGTLASNLRRDLWSQGLVLGFKCLSIY